MSQNLIAGEAFSRRIGDGVGRDEPHARFDHPPAEEQHLPHFRAAVAIANGRRFVPQIEGRAGLGSQQQLEALLLVRVERLEPGVLMLRNEAAVKVREQGPPIGDAGGRQVRGQ